MNAKTDSKPWWKQFWPWLLMAWPASVVVASFASLWIALEEHPDAEALISRTQGHATAGKLQTSHPSSQGNSAASPASASSPASDVMPADKAD